MEKIVEIATKQLEERAKSLKWEMEKDLDDKVEQLKEQFQILAELKLPTDILQLYMENEGRLWVSKRVFVEDLRLSNGARNLFYRNDSDRASEFSLPRGAYRLVLMAIPTTLDEGARCDDYNYPVIR